MAVLKQGLNCDYDHLGELVNYHQMVRQMLQHVARCRTGDAPRPSAPVPVHAGL